MVGLGGRPGLEDLDRVRRLGELHLAELRRRLMDSRLVSICLQKDGGLSDVKDSTHPSQVAPSRAQGLQSQEDGCNQEHLEV